MPRHREKKAAAGEVGTRTLLEGLGRLRVRVGGQATAAGEAEGSGGAREHYCHDERRTRKEIGCSVDHGITHSAPPMILVTWTWLYDLLQDSHTRHAR